MYNFVVDVIYVGAWCRTSSVTMIHQYFNFVSTGTPKPRPLRSGFDEGIDRIWTSMRVSRGEHV